MGEFEGQVALVTGGVRRIGRAIALDLARGGARVVINARSSQEEAEAVQKEIAGLGGSSLVHLADVTDEAQVQHMIERAVSEFGRIDIVINNAAIRKDTGFAEMSFAEWREVTSIILDGAFLVSRAAVPHMIARNFGRIVNIGGVSAHMGASRRAHVVAAKAGIAGLTRALATELAEHGITVNCVAPGKIGGQRSATSGHGVPGGKSIVGREGTPEDVANTVIHLCRHASSYVTGQTLHVSGGMMMP